MIPLPALKFLDTLKTKALDNVGSIKDDAISGRTADSLIEVSQPTRVEPIALIDSGVEHLPYITDVLQATNSIFAGYYLSAAALTVNVGRVDVLKYLDRLNPSRDPWVGVMSTENFMLRTDSYQTQLPLPGQPLGLENFALEGKYDGDDADNSKGPGFSFGKDAVKELRENSNLSVGKLIEVTIEDDGRKITVPINVRLIASTIDGSLLSHILTEGSKDLSITERWHSYRAGQIEFIRDLIFCVDLIDDRKKMLMKDTKGQYSEILKRRRANNLATFISGKTSLATASNILVISDATRKGIERSQGVKFSSAQVRERMFKDTYVMLLVIIDPEHEYVTIYHRSIALPTELTVRSIKASNKGTGPDLTDILKAYQMGNNPSY